MRSPSTPLPSPRTRIASSALDLAVVVRDDQLSAAGMRHVVGRTELVEHARAVHAVPCLQAAGRIVHAAVNHLAVVRAGAHAGLGSRSRTQTLRPRCASDHAVASPTTPAPMTAVSICSILNYDY
jgi:hypothetical protein